TDLAHIILSLSYDALQHLHSFPTRRSSDLSCGRVNLPPIRGGADQANIQTGGTRQGFNLVGCTTAADLSRLGFTSNALTFTPSRSEEHTSELQSRENLVCRLLLEKKKFYS